MEDCKLKVSGSKMMNDIIFKIISITKPRGLKIYLVGGFLRDCLLESNFGDIDLAVEGSVKEIAMEVAQKLPGTFVPLDSERSIYRVVVTGGDSPAQIDFEGLAPGGISEDLKRRDFTINALALPLSSFFGWVSKSNLGQNDLKDFLNKNIIDATGGLNDLRSGIIRPCGSSSLEDDPLRALRAFRLASGLGFSLEPGTLDLIRHMKQPITTCSGERIRGELEIILSRPSSKIIRLMAEETNLLQQIFPELTPLIGMGQGGHHVDDVFEHSLKTFETMEILLDDILASESTALKSYLLEGRPRGRHLLPVVKLACLLHDVGKQFCRKPGENGKFTFYGHHREGVPVAWAVADRLKFSALERGALENLVGWHMDPLFLYKMSSITPRALRRFFKKGGCHVPGLLLLSLADVTSTRLASGKVQEAVEYRCFIYDLLERYFREGKKYISPPIFLSGSDICDILSIPPGPAVGYLLNKLQDAVVDGKVTNRSEAEAFIVLMEQGPAGGI